MRALKQFAAVTSMNLRSIRERPASSSVILIGIMGVVLVLVCLLALGGSLAENLRSTGSPDRAIVLRAGADNEAGSSVFVDEAQTVMRAPGIARSAEGDPIATADMIDAVSLPRKKDDSRAGVMIRGMTERGTEVRPEIRVVEGRWFERGLSEVVVGRAAHAEFSGLGVGDRVRLRGGEWTVVGVFESGNGLEGSVLADATTLMSAYRRAPFNSVTVRLESRASFDAFKNALTTDPTLSVDVIREVDYYRRLAEDISAPLRGVSYVIGAIMAVGAVFGALNTMYTTVSNRRIEIATLRAIGFGPGGLVASVLAEAMILAAAGALAGAGIAWVLLSGNTFSLGATEGSIVAQLRVTPQLLGIALVWACAVGFMGGLVPAIRAATMPVASAFKAE